MQTLVSGAHLSGVKSATDAPRRVHLRRKPDVKCFFSTLLLRIKHGRNPLGSALDARRVRIAADAMEDLRASSG